MKNLTILTFYNQNYKELGELTSKNFREYSDRHNFKLVVRNENYLCSDRPPAWAKIRAIKEEFENTNDWIMWIDCDALITNHKINALEHVDENFDIIFSTDGFYAKPWHYWPSTAVFFIKKSPKTIELLDKIWDQPDEVINHCWWEQMGLLKALNENPHLRSCYKVEKYKKIFTQKNDWQNDDFIMHIGGGLKMDNEKLNEMNNFIKNTNKQINKHD